MDGKKSLLEIAKEFNEGNHWKELFDVDSALIQPFDENNLDGIKLKIERIRSLVKCFNRAANLKCEQLRCELFIPKHEENYQRSIQEICELMQDISTSQSKEGVDGHFRQCNLHANSSQSVYNSTVNAAEMVEKFELPSLNRKSLKHESPEFLESPKLQSAYGKKIAEEFKRKKGAISVRRIK